ncbi:MAG: hypothetical protein JF601_08660 [Acidobacteria bacterium]|nr:hypothetical protein [Acidobacteriota bacterium]
MVVVEEDRIDAYVVARRFALFVFVGADRRERRIALVGGAAEEADALDPHLATVVGDVEVGRREIGDRFTAPVGDDRVHLHERRPAAKDRRRLRRCLLRLRNNGGRGQHD